MDSMDLEAEIDFASTVFAALVTGKMDRLKRGQMLRQQMHDAIKRGERPVGARPEWLRRSAVHLINVLGTQAEEFDNTHADDKASVSDLMDILVTAMGLLKSHSKG